MGRALGRRACPAAPVLAAAVLLGGCGGGDGLPPTRIVLVTIDTLRNDALELMPRTRAFAERGVRLERAYAATATTQPTHASLFTGLHPWEHGVTRNGQVLGEDFDTLAERLGRRGFETAGVAASFPMERGFGLAQGFGRYHDEFTQLYVREWEGEAVEGGKFYSLADHVTGQALRQLEEAKGELQFFWFHYFDPHDPYGDHQDDPRSWIGINHLLGAAGERRPDAGELVRRARGLYDDDVRELDRALGPLFEALEAGEDRFATHVFFTSDHGESFGEKGCLGHGKRLVPEQIEVPLVYVGPARDRAKAARGPCGSVDVATTILRLAGDTSRTSGRDLFASGGAPLAFGMRRTFASPKFEQLLDGRRLPIEGERFYLVGEGQYVTGNGEELFHEDDLERPYAGEAAERVRGLFSSFEERLEGRSSEELADERVREAMRTLGYVD